MFANFWINRAGNIRGPFSEDQLRQKAACGEIVTDDLVSKDQVRWTRADQIKGLTIAVNVPPPPLAASTPQRSLRLRYVMKWTIPVFIAVLLCVVAVVMTAWPAVEEGYRRSQARDKYRHEAEESLTKGREHLAQGNKLLAENCFRDAASFNADARAELGLLLMEDDRTFPEGIILLEQSALEGSSHGMVQLGIRLALRPIDQPPSEQDVALVTEGLRWLDRGAATGDAGGVMALGMFAAGSLMNGTSAESVREVFRAADVSESNMLCAFGYAYMTTQDYTAAAEYYRQALKLGNAHAQGGLERIPRK